MLQHRHTHVSHELVAVTAVTVSLTKQQEFLGSVIIAGDHRRRQKCRPVLRNRDGALVSLAPDWPDPAGAGRVLQRRESGGLTPPALPLAELGASAEAP